METDQWSAIGIKNMKNDTLKIVDFYFTNSLDDLNSVKNILEKNNIPHTIIQNNNNHPYFGINTTIGIEKKSLRLCYSNSGKLHRKS